MTINAAASDLRKADDPDLGNAAKIAASAMLRGARGNSGVILSLLFRGISKKLKGCDHCDGVLWAAALQEGVDAAYKAVMKPAEGTILTVSRLAAAKAQDAAKENNFIEFVQTAAIEEARIALANTVNQNPVLKKAGVVDAGGKGWLIALEAMLSSMQGEDVVAESAGDGAAVKEAADFSDFNTEDITFTYCTEFIIDRENDKDPEALRSYLSGLGDSLVLVDDDEIIKVHVHTNDPGKALSEAVTYGSFVTVKIENMRLQHTEKVMTESEKEPKIAGNVHPADGRDPHVYGQPRRSRYGKCQADDIRAADVERVPRRRSEAVATARGSAFECAAPGERLFQGAESARRLRQGRNHCESF